MERTLGKNKQISKDDRKSSKIQIPVIGILKQFFQVIGFELGPAAFIKQLQVEHGFEPHSSHTFSLSLSEPISLTRAKLNAEKREIGNFLVL